MDDDDWYEREQLHFAAMDGDLAKVQTLLQSKPNLHYFDTIGCTPLHYAVEKEHYAVARVLLAAGADINAHDAEHIGETPLGRVVRDCTPEMARFLIDNGADPTIPGWMALTALFRAARRQDDDGPEVLNILQNAQNRHVPNTKCLTPNSTRLQAGSILVVWVVSARR
jgi:ankyrin repeat protein